ncbi:UNVERIFIED_CONTAM: hypothetical protein GTU68_007747 [Idotea baltica]|nr:hypothetical protein [Idotea baltica]
MLKQGYNREQIATAINKCPSVLSREIKRNKDIRSGEYRSKLAQRKAEDRLMTKNKCIKFTPKVQKYVDQKLELQWSPEQISNRHCDNEIQMVSHERIYQYIIQDKKQGGELYKNLRRKKKYRKRIGSQDNRGKIKNATSIKERPKEVDQRARVGDFEVDLVIGANHKSALVTINDLKTGFSKVRKVKSKNAKEVAKKIVEILTPYKAICKTITSDNGKEFADHRYVSKQLGIDFFFADPYSSWQRGANENYNGLLRQYFPKKTNFNNISWQEIRRVERLLNNRPRKRLKYKTPIEVINSLTKVAFAA